MSKAPPQQASLSIDFVIIGGGVAGLASAIALQRVGHRTLVLEKNPTIHNTTSGCRMPPNLSKILYHWGLEQKLRSIAIKSHAIDLLLDDTGELLGKHHWDEEMLKETRGEFIAAHHSDLRKLLYDTASSYGAKICLNTEVVSADPEGGSVTLASGEILRADVIIGADGIAGMSRGLLLDADGGSDDSDHVEGPRKMNMYSTTVPKQAIMGDAELASFYDREFTSMFAWFGHHRMVLGFPLGGTPDFALYIYGPQDGNEGSWEDKAPVDGMHAILGPCEPRLRKLGQLASTTPTCVSVQDYPELEDWVHESGRMVVIGEAAHPLPAGSLQEAAMTVEDAAVLAKLFSHLRSPDQISVFLWAFQDLRQPRCASVLQKEFGDIRFMSLPPGEFQQMRDDTMRAKRDAGLGALEATDDLGESPEWEQIKEVFAYDAEDEADNWWHKWGLLRERAQGKDIACGLERIQVAHEKAQLFEGPTVRSISLVQGGLL